MNGNFPYCYWNGGMNNNKGNGVMYPEIKKFGNREGTPIRLNCANIFLQEEDYDNVFSNLILKTLENGSNAIEISNLKLMDKII